MIYDKIIHWCYCNEVIIFLVRNNKIRMVEISKIKIYIEL